jgi:GAF domain-containing protein
LKLTALTDDEGVDGSADNPTDGAHGGARRMSPRPLSDASAPELAAIELRRISDVLQVDHVSLFLPNPDAPERTAMIASTGAPVDEALPRYADVVARVIATARVEQIHHVSGDPRAARSAIATPLLDGGRAIGALLVVTARGRRRFGLFEAQVLNRASETLVARILAPMDRAQRRGGSDRFGRDAGASPRLRPNQ